MRRVACTTAAAPGRCIAPSGLPVCVHIVEPPSRRSFYTTGASWAATLPGLQRRRTSTRGHEREQGLWRQQQGRQWEREDPRTPARPVWISCLHQ